MPKKQMRKIIPDPSALRDSWVGNLLGDILKDPYLFHLNRRSVSLGVMVGLFWAFTPLPFQMLPAAITAWIIRANLPLSVALVWISNPVTVPPLLLIAYGIGSWILDTPVLPPDTGITMDWVKSQLLDVWKPLVLGCLLMSVISAAAGYLIMRFWWIAQVRQSWKDRLLKRAGRSKE